MNQNTSSPSSDNSTYSDTEPFHATALAASLTVKDVPASLAWYRDILGFTVDREHVREEKLIAVSLKAGAVQILIGQDDGAKGSDRIKGAGISLMFTTSQDADALASRIKNAGGILESDPVDTPWGARVFRILDPDGFRLTISSVTQKE